MQNDRIEALFRSRDNLVAGNNYVVAKDGSVHLCVTMIGHGIWYFKHFEESHPDHRRHLGLALNSLDTLFEGRPATRQRGNNNE